MNLRQLNIKQICELYEYVNEGLDVVEPSSSLKAFSLALLDRFRDNPEGYLKTLLLLTDLTEEEILTLSSEEALGILLSGLQLNKIMKFYGLIQRLRVSNGERGRGKTDNSEAHR